MSTRVAVIGAGMGGLAAAAMLAARGHSVTVLEKERGPGGKARRLTVDGAQIDAGPTVFTQRDLFEQLFEECGSSLTEYVNLKPADVLARHAWGHGQRLDLFADPQRSEDAVGVFAGKKEAEGFRRFQSDAARIYSILEHTMLDKPKPATPLPLMWRIGLNRISDLSAARPYETMWKVLAEYFADERLRQLFGRYATYCGSSPLLSPATLMLIAHVEARGVWMIEGGIPALARAMQSLGEANGARYRYGSKVARVLTHRGKASGVLLESGEVIEADAVIANADPSAIAQGHLGEDVSRAVRPIAPAKRSLSAFVWLAHARTSGFPLARHNVFFSRDYPREFKDLAAGYRPTHPSVYVCAQDRDETDGAGISKRERLQIIVNAPANGDTHRYSGKERERCTQAMKNSLRRCGLELEEPTPFSLLTPNEFEALLPSTGGAIYGRASHGWAASFLRQGTRTRTRGLYCAGGSTHPGAGVPMAALSGLLAAQVAMRDLASTRRFHPVAMAGGTSMQSAMTGSTG